MNLNTQCIKEWSLDNKNMDARHRDKEDPPVQNNASTNFIYIKG
jgi:hypothetical protein